MYNREERKCYSQGYHYRTRGSYERIYKLENARKPIKSLHFNHAVCALQIRKEETAFIRIHEIVWHHGECA